MAEAKRQLYLKRWGALETERSSWLGQWREISEHLLPRSGRFLTTDRNRGDKKHNAIYDSTGTRALRILAAGMMAGMTSPARPWFRLATHDPELMEFGPVKVWLDEVTTLMRAIFARSNTYRALHSLYEELGAFGTAASIVLPDFEDVIRHYPLTIGEYAIATDHRGNVTTIYRLFDMTVAQMVSDFGIENVSVEVKNLYDQGKGLDAWRPVLHVIEPRVDREANKRDAKNLPWASCYFEFKSNENKVLRESGFNRFVGLVPRWSVSGGDIYGNGPGMEALGDVKQLQHGQLRKAQGIDYKVKPPLQAPTALKDTPLATLPGGVAYVESIGAQNAIKTMFDVNIDLNAQLEDIRDVRQRINSSFYADLFLMLAQAAPGDMTAREVVERHEEKLLMLGPVLERLHNELLTPLIDNTFDRMLEAGIVPPPPQELQGTDLNVEFVSMLAQAQRAVGTGAVDRLLNTVGTIATFETRAGKGITALDKIDTDQIVDGYADMLGVDPKFIVADDKVAIIRETRAKQQAAAAQAAQAPELASTAKTLSETDTEGKNALTDVMRQFSGYATA